MLGIYLNALSFFPFFKWMNFRPTLYPPDPLPGGGAVTAIDTFTRLGRWMFPGWMRGRKPDAVPVKAVIPDPPARRSFRTGCLDPKTFVTVLGEMIQADKSQDLRLQVFSLVEFREALASKWHRLGRLLEVAIPAIARQHINAEKDIFAQIDSEVSLLASTNTHRQQVRTCVASIARDVAHQLFGDAVINGRRPKVIITSIPLYSALATDGNLDHRAIATAIAQAESFLKPPQAVANGPTAMDVAEPHRSTLAALMKEPLPISSLSGGKAEVSVALPSWMDRQLDEQAVAAKSGDQLTGDSSLTLLWTPTWVTAQSKLGAFQARLIRVDRDGEAPLEGSKAYQNITPVEALTLDRFVATQTAQELKKLHFANQHVGLVMPVYWLSLAPRWRDCVRLPIMDCPVAARRKFLKIEIFGISSAMPSYMFNYMFEPMEAVGCDVMVRLPLADAKVIPLLRSVKAVGIDLAELSGQDRVGDAELFRKITHFRATARNYDMACYIWGVRRRPLIAKMIENGFSFINGPGVMCDLGHPALPQQGQQAA